MNASLRQHRQPTAASEPLLNKSQVVSEILIQGLLNFVYFWAQTTGWNILACGVVMIRRKKMMEKKMGKKKRRKKVFLCTDLFKYRNLPNLNKHDMESP